MSDEDKEEAIRQLTALKKDFVVGEWEGGSWEDGFLSGLLTRLETYGADIFLSEKQMAKLDDIYCKHVNRSIKNENLS